MGDRPLIVVLGPTGSGKSELALRIAEDFRGEIINSDSVQVYRGFDIGSAKTPLSGRRGIPHHLIDVADPDQVFTAGEYARLGRSAIQDISDRDRLPVVAGGTGFYVRALLDGLFAGPERDEGLRSTLMQREESRPGFLWRALRLLDATTAKRIHPNDRNKVLRALEVCILARRPMTALLAEGQEALEGYATLKLLIVPQREALYAKLDARSEAMFDGGLVAEVSALLAQGVLGSAKPFESIGYKQALRFVRGEMTREEAIEEMRRDTRRYAKRQMTWWRRDSEMTTVSGFGTDETVVRSILDIVRNHVSNRMPTDDNTDK